jgi:hypothetical protein
MTSDAIPSVTSNRGWDAKVPSPIPVAVIGLAARKALGTPGKGVVLAVFERSFYIKGLGERLACLGSVEIGPGPLNVLCPLPANGGMAALGVTPGIPVIFTANALRLDGGAVFSFAEAKDWWPPVLPTWRAADLRLGLDTLATATRAGLPDYGLGSLIPALAGGGGVAALTTEMFDPLLRPAMRGVAALVEWLYRWAPLVDGVVPPPPREAEILIGLGPGLTPSGDDFLAGALIALRALRRHPAAERLADWTLSHSATGTGIISQAHLACATEGAGASALHNALAAVVTPDLVGFDECLSAVAALGQCSGWDAMAGVTAACAALATPPA